METRTPIPATIRVAQHRERRRAGLARFSFVADEISVKQLLEDAHVLSPIQWDDPAAVERALSAFIGVVVREKL